MSEPADGSASPAPQEAEPLLPGTNLASEELEDVLARRRSPRWRTVQVALSLMVVLLGLGVVLQGSLPPLLPRIGYAPPTQSPTAPPFSATVASNVSFGTVIVNGKKLGRPPLTVTLHQGDNEITLSAPPFLPRSCHVMVNHAPQNGLKICDVLSENTSSGVTISSMNGSVSSWVGGTVSESASHNAVNMSLTADDLPPDLRANALAAVAGALATAPLPAAIVPAGQYYATGIDPQGGILSQRAAVPLTATMTLSPSNAASDGSQQPGVWNGSWESCADLRCAPPVIEPDLPVPTGRVWTVFEAVSLTWRFTTGSGEPAGVATFPVPDPLQLALTYDATVGWQLPDLAFLEGGPLGPGLETCSVGAHLVQQDLDPNNQHTRGMGWANPPNYGIQGCVLQVQNQDGTSAGTFVWRFGVLLAADAQAHALLPALPVAPPDEIAAVTS